MKNTKICFKCGEDKPLSEYYVHKQMADGHLNKCKKCTKKDVKKHRSENLERIQDYDRRRQYDPKRKETLLRCQRNRRKKNPEKQKAYRAVRNAIHA